MAWIMGLTVSMPLDKARSHKYICVSPRCGLCRYEIHGPDEVVVVGEQGRPSQSYTYGQGFTDERLQISYFACHNRCDCGDYARIRACHVGCAAVVDPDQVARLVQISAAKCELPLSEEKRMTKWFQLQMLPLFYETFRRLPMEICYSISDYSIQEYSVGVMRDLWKQAHAVDSEVTTAKSVWAQYISIEGRDYVTSLSNSPSGDGRGPIFETCRRRAVGQLYIAEDHLGIRQIIFSKENRPPPSYQPVPGVWWRVLPLLQSRSRPRLTGHTDGLKLCSLSTPDHPPTTGSHSWAIPIPYVKVPKVDYIVSTGRAPLRMGLMNLNSPNVTGYSFLWHYRLVGIHAHSPGRDELCPWENSKPEKAVSIYIPINQDEVITEIWKLRAGSSYTPTLHFKTNQGRQTLVGPYVESGTMDYWDHWDFQLFKDISEDPRQMFYDESPAGIRGFAFDQGGTGKLLSINSPRRDCPITLFTEPRFQEMDGFHTFASLRGVTEIIPSVRHVEDSTFIIGLLLYYETGHRACLGQCQLTSLGEALLVEPDLKLWIGAEVSEEVDPQEADSQEVDPQEVDSQEVDSQEVGSQEVDSQEADSQEADSQEAGFQRVDSQKCDSQIVSCTLGDYEPNRPDLKFLEVGWDGTLEWRVARNGNFVRYRPA